MKISLDNTRESDSEEHLVSFDIILKLVHSLS